MEIGHRQRIYDGDTVGKTWLSPYAEVREGKGGYYVGRRESEECFFVPGDVKVLGELLKRLEKEGMTDEEVSDTLARATAMDSGLLGASEWYTFLVGKGILE